jgi:hypothetical protein
MYDSCSDVLRRDFQSDAVDDLSELVSAMGVDTNHRFNFLESKIKESEERIMAAILGRQQPALAAGANGQDDT